MRFAFLPGLALIAFQLAPAQSPSPSPTPSTSPSPSPEATTPPPLTAPPTTPAPTPAESAAAPSPTKAWKFDEAEGQWLMESGGSESVGYLGIEETEEENDPKWITANGKSALQFDGADDCVLIPDWTSEHLAAFTYSVWVYPLSIGENNQGCILSHEKDATHDAFHLSMNPNRYLRCTVRGSEKAKATVLTRNKAPLNTWTHLAVTFDNAGDRKVHLYINGEEATYMSLKPLSGELPLADLPLYVGNRANGEGTFEGVIDAVEVYDCSLTSDQIKERFKSVWSQEPLLAKEDLKGLKPDPKLAEANENGGETNLPAIDFAALDSNGNGKVDENEFFNYVGEQSFTYLNRNKDEAVQRAEAQRIALEDNTDSAENTEEAKPAGNNERVVLEFDTVDWNTNAQLTRSELRAAVRNHAQQFLRIFRKLDQNGDESINAEEWSNYIKLPEARGGRGALFRFSM